MNVAIIGGGLTGLTSAYELLKAGYSVTVFEKEKTLGGLAGGFKCHDWNWSLEYFYHHFFTNDRALISLAKELGLEKDMLILRPITATLIRRNIEDAVSEKFFVDRFPSLTSQGNELRKGKKTYDIFQLDSPATLFTFPLLTPFDKLRTGALLTFCKINPDLIGVHPFWLPLEKITAEKLFKKFGGTRAWKILWEPLMRGKFGKYAPHVPASWLWARFHKRTPNLGYFKGGFQTLIDALTTAITYHGGIIYTKSEITSIQHNLRSRKYEVRVKQPNHLYAAHRTSNFDDVLITTPSPIAIKLIEFPKSYEQKLKTIPHLSAQTLVLETKEPILHKIYWLNIADSSFPFVAVVAHTNIVDKKYYGGNHITYIGNYLPDGHPFLKMSKQQLLKTFFPYLQKISQQCNHITIQHSHLFTSANAQPVHSLNYSQKAPLLRTPIKGIYLANLDSIYPWDRGTNYAIALGKKAAEMISSS